MKTSIRSSRPYPLLLAAGLAAALAACSAPSATPSSDEGSPAPSGVAVQAQAPAEVPDGDPTFTVSGTTRAGEPATLQVTDLVRLAGDAVEVQFTLTNDGQRPWDMYVEYQHSFRADATLVALAEDTVYEVLQTSADLCLCSELYESPPLAAGETRDFYAQFPAPQADEVQFRLVGFDAVHGIAVPTAVGVPADQRTVPADAETTSASVERTEEPVERRTSPDPAD